MLRPRRAGAPRVAGGAALVREAEKPRELGDRVGRLAVTHPGHGPAIIQAALPCPRPARDRARVGLRGSVAHNGHAPP